LVLLLIANGCAVGVGEKASSGGNDDAGFVLGDGGAGTSGETMIYAHSDKELYSFDPSTHAITDIGPFTDGTSNTPTITDLAVNAAGDVWVNSETAIYRAAIPNGTGPVMLTLVANVAAASGQLFYALGFAPAGTLDAEETLVAGDNKGILYAVSTSGETTKLGTFGTNSYGDTYQLSGDVMFFSEGGNVRGLATVRSCYAKGGSCTSSNDILAEIDVAAMTAAYQSKTPASSLKKQFLGSGTGFGRLFGVGAWDSHVYAFSRSSGTTPAQLIEIDNLGNGQVVQSFNQISGGWSGAGVTTSAKITFLPN
jgi:hypothetical protein